MVTTQELTNIKVPNEFSTIKVPKDIAHLVRIYCIFNNQKVYDFTGKVLEKELEEFKKSLKVLSR